MIRISGLVAGLVLLVVMSQCVSPASAWDHDDDDGFSRGGFKHNRHSGFFGVGGRRSGFGPGILLPGALGGRNYYSRGFAGPQPVLIQQQPVLIQQQPAQFPQQPIVPPPLPPSAFQQNTQAYPPAPAYPSNPTYPPAPSYPPQSNLLTPPQPSPPPAPVPQGQPGQFVPEAVPLYPYVQVKDANKVPAFAVQRILAVASPDPLRFPGCVYVPVSVPPTPCQGVKVKDGGAKTVLNYGEFEVEVTSNRGVVTVDYDD